MLGYKTLKINVNFIRKKSGNILKIHVTNKQNEKKNFFFVDTNKNFFFKHNNQIYI
jgi:hypothetical protein